MDISVGLPHTIPGAPPRTVLDWAAEADEAGFAGVATLDRLVYGNHETITTLAAAAAVTTRVRLTTCILISPLRNTALLAKQAATVDQLSGGRLTLGMAVGSRQDDFKAGGADYATRGRRMTEQIAELRSIWAGERRGFAGGIGPAPTTAGGPPILLGGHSPAAIARAARLGDGWVSGSGGVRMFDQGANQFRRQWADGGRTGEPRLVALAYYALGPNAEKLAGDYLGDYYGFAPPYARLVVGSAAIGQAGLRQVITAFGDAGCDELVLAPCSADLDQLKELREITQ